MKSFQEMLKKISWETKNRSGLGMENDASEFLRVLMGKIISDLKDVMQQDYVLSFLVLCF